MSQSCAGGCGLRNYVEIRHLWKDGYCMECFQRNIYLQERLQKENLYVKPTKSNDMILLIIVSGFIFCGLIFSFN